MPTEAELMAEALVRRFMEEEQYLYALQLNSIKIAPKIQDAPYAFVAKTVQTQQQRMRKLNADVLDFYRKNFEGIFMAGARKIDPTYTLTKEDNRLISSIANDHYLKIRGAIEQVPIDTRRWLGMIRENSSLRRGKYVRNVQTQPGTEIRLRGIKAISYENGKRHTLGNYGKMSTRSAANRLFNHGTLQAAKKKELKFLLVSDGPECGWSYHGDPTLANGMIVTLDEARAYPIAHPYCQRTFSPAPPDAVRKEHERRERRTKERLQKAAKYTAIGLGALELTNLAGAGAQALFRGTLREELMSKLAKIAFNGNRQAQYWLHRLNMIEDFFGAETRALAQVYRGVWESGAAIGEQGLRDFPLNVARKALSNYASILPGGVIDGLKSLPQVWEDMRIFADGFLRELTKDIPPAIERAIMGAERATVEKMGLRFQMFYRTVKQAAMSEEFGENVIRLIDFEAKRRGAFDAILRLGGQAVGEVRASWSKWGPRLAMDVTDWVRGRITLTPTGIISSVTVNAKGAVRGLLKMYQDGTIGAHVSVIPKQFLRGVVRGIIEIDERGQLVGNIRLVPGGPLRLRMEFWTGAARTDLRDFLISPLGALGDLGARFRKFEFKRLVVELRIFNASVFDISASLRIPVNEVRDAIRTISTLRKAGELYTGTFRYVIENQDLVKEMLKGTKGTIFGNIRFSSLTNAQIESNAILSMLRTGNVRLLNRVKLSIEGLQNIATNMRIHGWNIYNVADVLGLRWDQTKWLVQNGLWRIRILAENLGITHVDDLLPAWEGRVATVMKMFARSSVYNTANKADMLEAALESVRVGFPSNVRPIQLRALLQLAGVERGDVEAKVYLKVRTLVDFLKMNEGLDSERLMRLLQELDDRTIRFFAGRVSRLRNPVLRVAHFGPGDFKGPGTPGPVGGRGVYEATRRKGLFGDWTKERQWFDWRRIMPEDRTGLQTVDTIFMTDSEGVVHKIEVPKIFNKTLFQPMLREANPALWDDVFDEYRFMNERYGLSPYFIVRDDIRGPISTGDGWMGIPYAYQGKTHKWWTDWDSYLQNYGAHRIQVQDVTGGRNPVWIHEYAHQLQYTVEEEDPEAIKDLLGKVADTIGADAVQYQAPFGDAAASDIIANTMRVPTDEVFLKTGADEFDTTHLDAIAEEFGTYAFRNTSELVAEAVRHYLTDDNPGPIALVVGRWFDDYYGVPEALRR